MIAAVALVALVVTAAPAILSLFLNRSRDEPAERWEPIATMRELVEEDVIYDPRWGVFLVNEPQAPIALYAVSPHNPGGNERVLFCPESGWFEATAHGEMFDRRGTYAVGPASRGLDRFDVRVLGDTVEVNVRVVYRGSERDASRPDAPRSSHRCGDQGWIEAEPGFWGPPQGFDGPI
ncbi:MAG TPA: hypothetical protein VGB52_12510 [Actinomycetota bacterium]